MISDCKAKREVVYTLLKQLALKRQAVAYISSSFHIQLITYYRSTSSFTKGTIKLQCDLCSMHLLSLPIHFDIQILLMIRSML